MTHVKHLRIVLRTSLLMLTLLASACSQATATIVEPTSPPPTEETVPTQAVPPTTAHEPTPEPISFIDDFGREVSIPEPAQRVVSLAPSSTEILFAVGAGLQVVGRDELSDYPTEAIEVASIGTTYGELNVEAIVALEPDLVLAADINSPEHVQALG
jgi:iron complex transport system substrate-binding protein